MSSTPNDASEEPATIASLPSELLLKCFGFLLPSFRDLTTCSSVCRVWHALITSDTKLWRDLAAIFGLDIDDDDELDYRLAFIAFASGHRGFTDIYPEQKALFNRLKTFLAASSPNTLALLRPPMPLANLLALAPFESVTAASPAALRSFALWFSFADGQRMPSGEEEEPGDFGLFGTFTAYDEVASVRWLPGGVVKELTLKEGVKVAVFALSLRSGKHLALVTSTPPHLSALLHTVIETEFDSTRYIPHGPFPRFINNYISALESQQHRIDSAGRISMFPESGPGTSSATTDGIQATVSSMFTPEHRNPQGHFVYRIRLEFLPSCPYPSAQLESRRWRIRYRSGKEEIVEGRAVVGLYPYLGFQAPAERDFEYCSYCTGRNIRRGEAGTASDADSPWPGQDPPVWMEGGLTFVPGSLRQPIAGEEKFEVEIARWYFQWPSVLGMFGPDWPPWTQHA